MVSTVFVRATCSTISSASILAFCMGGCAQADSIVRSWDIRVDGKATDRNVTIGQTKADARAAIGDLLEQRNEDLWIVRGQFAPFTPGLYPYFDSRVVSVYLLDDQVAAIVIRGEYLVYP